MKMIEDGFIVGATYHSGEDYERDVFIFGKPMADRIWAEKDKEPREHGVYVVVEVVEGVAPLMVGDKEPER